MSLYEFYLDLDQYMMTKKTLKFSLKEVEELFKKHDYFEFYEKIHGKEIEEKYKEYTEQNDTIYEFISEDL